MSAINEVLEAMKSLESTLNGYLSFDADVGGLVSQSIKELVEARALLRNPTKENVQEVLRTAQRFKDRASPYAAEAPDVMMKIDSVIGKLRAL